MKTTLVAAALVAIAASVHQPSATPAAQSATHAPSAPPARSERAVPFHAGESLTYDVSWSSYVTAGTVVTTVKSTPMSGSAGYHIVADGRTTALLQALYTLHYTM
jgi:hypothetical protein